MNPDFYLLIDPRTKQRSISFTMLIITFIALLVSQGLLIFGKVNNTGQLLEIFISTCSLYFGTHVIYKGQEYGADKVQKIEQTIEKVTNEISN